MDIEILVYEGYTMNYILENDRSQVRIECIEVYINGDSEVRIIDSLNIESLGFKIRNHFTAARPMYNPSIFLNYLFTDILME